MGNFQTQIEITSILVFIEPRQPTLAPGNQLYFTFVKNPRHASKAIVASIQFNLGKYAQTFYNLLTLLKSFNVMFPRDSLTHSFCDGFISRKKSVIKCSSRQGVRAGLVQCQPRTANLQVAPFNRIDLQGSPPAFCVLPVAFLIRRLS